MKLTNKNKNTGNQIWFTSDSHFGHANIIKFCCRPFLTDEALEIRSNALRAATLIEELGLREELSEDQLSSYDRAVEEFDQWNMMKLPPEVVIEHDNILIDNWNSYVSSNDTVYHLGDFAFGRKENFPGGRREYVENILDRLNGEIHLIIGNHEKDAMRVKYRFKSISSMKEIKIPDEDAYGGTQRIVLCHYAMRVWNKSHRGAWHLYGHSHNSLEDDPNSLSFDVGVDSVASILSLNDELKRENYRPLSYSEVKDIISKKAISIDHLKKIK